MHNLIRKIMKNAKKTCKIPALFVKNYARIYQEIM